MKKINMLQFDAVLFSKYRSVLMGIGAIGVVLGHNLRWCDWPTVLSLPARVISAMVFTEGFLFLSGFGLFFSFDKDNDVKSFLAKRVNRLYLPFLLILLPFAVINLIGGFASGKSVLIDATCVPWFFGMGGYWYVALTLMLYAIYPLVHNYVFLDTKKMMLKCGILIVFLYIAIIAIQYFLPDYFSKVEIGLVKAPIFFVGMMCGYVAKNKKIFHHFIPLIVGCVAISFCWRFVNHTALSYGVSGSLLRILCMALICLSLEYLKPNGGILLKLLNWFGKYSLEIYLLHMMLHQLLVNMADSLGMEGMCQTLFVSLNIPFALLLSVPFQKMYKCVLRSNR